MTGASSSKPAVLPLTRVGRYEILQQLSDEGFVALFAARVRGPNVGPRIVELAKVQHGFAREVEIEAAFLAEARAASRVRHPNFVHPTDTLVHDGDLYVATELHLAVRLDELWRAALAQGYEIPLPVALRILRDALAGLSALHATLAHLTGSRAIVHGDVCPTNIAVGHLGESHLVHSGLSLITSRAGAGGLQNPRLPYKAPEQVRSGVNAVTIGPDADVFATGIILWEMLSGTRLFDAPNDVEVVERVLHAVIESPDRKGHRRVPASLLPLVTAALARDPERRPRFAADFGKSIENASGVRLAGTDEVARVVDELAGAVLSERRAQIERLVTLADESFPPESPLRNIVPELNRPLAGQGSLRPMPTASGSPSSRRVVPTKPSSGRLRVAPVASPVGLVGERAALNAPLAPAHVATFQGSSRHLQSPRDERAVSPGPPSRKERRAPVGWIYYGGLGAIVGTVVYVLIAGPVHRPVPNAPTAVVEFPTASDAPASPVVSPPLPVPVVVPPPALVAASPPVTAPVTSASVANSSAMPLLPVRAPRTPGVKPAVLPRPARGGKPTKPPPMNIPEGI